MLTRPSTALGGMSRRGLAFLHIGSSNTITTQPYTFFRNFEIEGSEQIPNASRIIASPG